MVKPYRSKSRLVLDVLHGIKKEGPVGVTRLLLLANLSHARLQAHLEDLHEKGWIDAQDEDGRAMWVLTEDGHEVLAELRRVDEAMKDFGLAL